MDIVYDIRQLYNISQKYRIEESCMTNDELSLKTKQMLAAALKDVLSRKPFSKVTVSELITMCNINRNTFYYHFEDKYALLTWMFEEEAFEVIKQFDMISDTENAIRFIMDYVEANDHIINCVYDSMGNEELKRFFYNDINGLFMSIVETGVKAMKLDIDPSFIEFLSKFYTEAAAGILIDWVKNRVSQDRETVLNNILLIFHVSVPAILTTKAKAGDHFRVPSEDLGC